jgi:hypothetical protein
MTHAYRILLLLSLVAIATALWVMALKPPTVINAEYYIEASGKVELHKWESQSPIKIKIPEIK